MLEDVGTVIPEGAAGLLLDGAESPEEAVVTEVLGAEVAPVGGEFPGTVSQKGLPPPPNENASSWLDSLVGGAGPVLFGVENPKPWDATLPPPELNVPVGFCSPKDELPNPPNVLAPLFPNRLEVFGVAVDPKPPLAELNGFLLAASWLGFPPRPLKKPPPLAAFPDPNTLPLEVDDCWPKTDPPVLAA